VIWPKKSKIEEKKATTIVTSSSSSTPAVPKMAVQPPAPVLPEGKPSQTKVAPTVTGVVPDEDRLSKHLGTHVRSVLSEGTVINGRLTFDTPVKIDGKLTGEVFSTDTLVIGKTGRVNATVDVHSLVVLGEVEGNVKARELIELMPGAKLNADVETKKFIVHEAVFNGNCKMNQKTS